MLKVTTDCSPVVSERILTPAFVRLLVAALGSGGSFFLLLSVVPLYVASAGSSDAGAGLTTGVMLAATVATEVGMTALLARFGYRVMMTAGLLLFGLPTLALLGTDALPLVLAVCAARGAGLAISVVAATALVAELASPARRGEAFGVYGIAAGLPAILGLPIGVYLSDRLGFDAVFLLAAGVALAGLLATPGLPGRIPGPRSEPPVAVGLAEPVLASDEPGRPDQVGTGRIGTVRVGTARVGMARVAVVFAAVTFSIGVVVTFLPLAVAGRTTLVAVGLFVQALLAMVTRWVAGWLGDRRGYEQLLVPSLLLTGVGVAALIWYQHPVAVIAGMVAYGLGYGAAQTVTLSLMFKTSHDHGKVSAIWNLAYDAGMGLGAVGFGFVVGGTGYALAFGLTAFLLAAVLPLTKR